MKKLMTVAAATVAAWCSWGAESISVDEVASHYPWDGKVDCVYTVSGLADTNNYEGVFTLSVKQGGATVRKAVTNALVGVDGTYTNTFDCASLFGEGLYPNGGMTVTLVKNEKVLVGVQLWKDGPYFAECNVGASKPEKYGYYFCWGDTVGYKRNAANNGWVSSKDGTATFEFTTGNCPTYNKSTSELTTAGYIDASGNLVAAHDAATVHLGAPWRLPTDAEMKALIDNCTTTWTNNWNGSGVNGRLVRGKGEYSSKSIFLPAAGFGEDSYLFSTGSEVGYWSSSPSSDYSNYAWYLYFGSSDFRRSGGHRYRGRSVRPLRGFAK